MKFAEVNNAQSVLLSEVQFWHVRLYKVISMVINFVILKFEVIFSTQKVSIQIQNWQFFSMNH